MEDYVVRLGRAPTDRQGARGRSGAPEGHESDAALSARSLAERRVRRRRRNLVVLLLLLLVAAWQRDVIEDWVGRAVHGAGEPVRRLQGVEQLRDASDTLDRVWTDQRSYDVGAEELEERAPDIDWDDTIAFRSCANGAAAVLVAKTTSGDVSRLFVRGSERGDVEGREPCPERLDDPAPWRP